jgi:hypothetical protein
MSFLKQKIRFGAKSAFQWWGIITFVFLGLMAASLILSAFVVYNYTFQTLEDAHTIILLNTETLINNVNIDAYNKALKALEIKNNTSGFNPSLRNIFSLVQISSPPSTTPTSTAVYEPPTSTP